MDRSRVGIVIPALNESETISAVVRAAGYYGLPIVVDDGSDDNTADLAIAAGAKVVSHGQNRGYDFALNSGFKKAEEMAVDVIITLDADGQHEPDLIQRFIDAIDDGAELAIGVRNQRQRISEHLFAWYTSLRFGINDPLCGMKAYRMPVYKSLGHFDSYNSIGTELMIFAARNGFSIVQIPIKVRGREGQSRFGHMLSANLRIMRAMLLSLWRVKRTKLVSA